MLKLQQSEVRDLEILANQGEGGNDHQEKGKTIRSGIAKSRTIRSGKTESRNTGSKITGRIWTNSRSWKNEKEHWKQDHWEDHLQQCHLLQCLAPTLALSQNAIMILLFVCFFRLVCY